MKKTFGDAQPLAARSAGYAAPDPVDKIADKNLLKRRNAPAKSFRIYGERGGNRTFNLLIKSQLLCQLSYAPESIILAFAT